MGGALTRGEHAVNVNGVEQRYHVHGTGPVCVIHPGDPGIGWSYPRMPRVEEHLTAVYIEPIGTGSSGRLPEHPRGYGVDRYTSQLAGFIETLDLSGFLLLGHSYGGLVALNYALEQPDRLSGLILYSTSAVNTGEVWAAAGEEGAAFARRFPDDPEAARVPAAWQAIPAISDDAECTAVLRAVLPVYFADHRSAESGFDALRSSIEAGRIIGDGKPFDVRSSLAGLETPTLVMVGEGDFLFGSRWAKVLVEGLARGTEARLDRCGHFAHIERPAAFADALTSWARERR